jgi:hypothetical protein
MRHLLGLLLAAAMAAALFFAATWGVTQLRALHGAALTSPHGLAALAAVGGTGLLAGLLLCVPWVSPLAAGLPGLLLLGWTGALVVKTQLALRYIPLRGHVYGSAFQSLLLNGTLALAGLAMVIPLFVPSRWRRSRDLDDDEADGPLPMSAVPARCRRAGAARSGERCRGQAGQLSERR